MRDAVIQTRNLTRCFGPRPAVLALDLDVPRGCVFGLLGRNGSGKTTMIRMLLGLLAPTRGSARVLDWDSQHLPPEARARIGYLAEGHRVYGWMRVRQCARFQARGYPCWNEAVFRAVADYFGLDRQARVRDLSKGQRAGLCLALTLAPEPELLVLDDPGLGLDPVARRALLEALVHVTRQADRTILFSSHLPADVERIADRIAVLDRGALRACCSVDAFRDRVRRIVLHFAGPPPALPAIPGLLHAQHAPGEIALTIANCDDRTERLLAGLGAVRSESVPPDLEDALVCYLGERGERRLLLPGAGGAA